MNEVTIKNNRLIQGDCLEVMKTLPDKSVDYIITSPPYNINTERSDCYYNNGYSHIDNLSPEQYLHIRVEEFKQMERILKDDGAILYNISYHKENPILPVKLINNVDMITNLTLADIISWKKNTAIPFQTSPTKLSRIVELVYVIVKKQSLHTFKTNKQVSKINEKTNQKFYKNYINFIEAKNNDGYKCKLKASFSQELVDKLIDIYVPHNSVILDCFSGINTTGLSCVDKNVKYIGIELNEENYEIGKRRINEKESG